MTWCEAIEHGKAWHEDSDTWRFREAFKTIAATFNLWPTPRQFIEAIPPRREKVEKPMERIESDEQRAINQQLAAESRHRVQKVIDDLAKQLRVEL